MPTKPNAERIKIRTRKLNDAKDYLKSSKSILAKETTPAGKKLWAAQVRADTAEVKSKQAALNRVK